MLAYRDVEFEQKTRHELEMSRNAQQHMLDVWNSLELSTLTNLFRLAHDPQGVYSETTKQETKEPIPEGRYSIAPGVTINTKTIPCPDTLYRASREARNQIKTGLSDLWYISPDGKTVELDEALSENLIESQNVIVQNEQQKKFVQECVMYVKMSNSVNEMLKSIPTMRMPAVPWQLTERSFPLISGLELFPLHLREI